MSQEVENKDNQVIDLISTAAHHNEMVERDGQLQKELVLDAESLYWSTRSVNSVTLGRFVYELKQLEALAFEAINHMSIKRASIIQEQLIRLVDSYKKSIDSKASESKRDGRNSRLTLIDKLSKNKQERVYTVNDEMKKSFFSGIMGNDVEKDNQ